MKNVCIFSSHMTIFIEIMRFHSDSSILFAIAFLYTVAISKTCTHTTYTIRVLSTIWNDFHMCVFLISFWTNFSFTLMTYGSTTFIHIITFKNKIQSKLSLSTATLLSPMQRLCDTQRHTHCVHLIIFREENWIC